MNVNATLFLQAVVFAILVWFTMKFVWPPITKALDERTQKIAAGLAAADKAKTELAAANAREAGLRKAVEALCAVLDRNDKKGPIPDVEMMFCWLAAQGVRVAFRSDGLSYMQKGKTT